MKKVSLALLGIGRIGKIHLQHIRQHFPQASVLAVADPQVDPGDFREKYGDQIRFTRDPQEAITTPGVEAVLICTPTSTHAGLIEAAAAAGKHIFCEKPMDLSLERTARLARQVEASGVKLMLGFNRRFDPDFARARQTVQEGRIGKIQIVKITSRDPGLPPLDYLRNSGGLFMDMAIHDFDMARFQMGKEVTEVYARGMAWVDPAVAQVGDIDTALTTLVFSDGTYGVIDNSRKAVYGYDQRLEIFGSEGMIQVDNNLHHQNLVFSTQRIEKSLPLDFFMDRYTRSYLKEIELFIDCLTQNKPVPVGASDALAATRIAVAARRSMEENRPVKLEEISTGH